MLAQIFPRMQVQGNFSLWDFSKNSPSNDKEQSHHHQPQSQKWQKQFLKNKIFGWL
jgi:hypothetical protein